MDVKYWEGGLTLDEVKAIEKIAEEFGGKPNRQELKPSKLDSLSDLKVLKPGGNSMFPWKGYAGFRLVGSGREGEFDLVIVTHYNVIIVELKHWHGELTAAGDNWYQNGEYRSRSAVSVTQNKVHLLTSRLNKCGREFPSFKGHKFDRPKVDFLVVLTGTADGSKLPPKDKEHVITLNEFLLLSEEGAFNKRFHPHPQANKSLNQDIPVFDHIFSEGETKPKSLIVDGYEAIEKIFPPENIDSVYTEFLSKNKNNKDDFALLRRWNFSELDDVGSKTREDRYKIVRHEKEVLSFIRLHDSELYNSCLRSLTNIDPDNITEEFYELYELPHNSSRFNEFISSYVKKYDEEEKTALVKIILNNFAALHDIKIAHRDIGDHSLWLSPSMKISLSSFMSAYHKPAGTVGKRREAISTGIIQVPEELNNSDHKGTEFDRDVYSLGILTWLVMQGKRLSPASIQKSISEINNADSWYAPVVQKAISSEPQNRFRSAAEFLASFSEKQPQAEKIELFDSSIIEQYKTEIKLYKTYVEDEEIVSNDLKEVYRSGQLLVKIWNNVLDNDDSNSIFSCKAFIEQIEKIQSLGINFIPAIRGRGITHKSELFLIQDFIDAPGWEEWASTDISDSEKLQAINLLTSHISYLHESELTHGDIHPGNILVCANDNELKIFIIDLPDFRLGNEEIKNHRYSPEAVTNATAAERDNYAVMRISCELLGIEWENLEENVGNEGLVEVIKTEKESNSGFISLDRFKQALKDAFESPTEDIKEINVQLSRKDFQEPIRILPDNGELFLFYEPSTKNADSVRILLSGVDSSWTIFFNPVNETIDGLMSPKKADDISPWVRDRSQITLPIKINIEPENYTDLSELQSVFSEHETFLIDSKAAIKENTNNKDLDEKLSKDIDVELRKLLSEIVQDEESSLSIKDEKIATKNIWKAILETEIEALPSIEVADEPRPDIKRNELVIPYDSDNEVLDGFDKEDDVIALKKVDDKEFVIGRVNIDQSTSTEVRVPLSSGKKSPKTGDVIFLRTKRDRASYNRRKKAMERVLNNNAVISNLTSYFEPSIEQEFTDYKSIPTDEELDRYDQHDESGNLTVSLNDAQRDAFRTLFSKGPLSLLQGPPGTGKTEFISAFVHYLLTEGNSQHILLVSQSHEAVNTAVERIRKHCARLKTPIDIVRFSNSEASVSEGLKDVYSRNLIEARRQSFIAETRERIKYIEPSLKLESDYIDAVLAAEFGIKKKIKNALRLQQDVTDTADEQLSASLSSSLESLCNQITAELNDTYSIEASQIELSTVGEKVDKQISALYGIGPHEKRRINALLELINDYKDRLSTNPGGYEEFLARTRTLVCGTCVGMGLGHLGLNQIQYDWVIIDEAARSISSELAIAMQSAKRVLLVGDHKQLPPLFQEEHKNAILRRLGVPRVEPFQSQIFKSDFEKAFLSPYGKEVGKSLLTQYRMAEPISRLVSDTFYDQPLITGDREVPTFYKDGIDVLKSAVTWLDTSECKYGYDAQDGTSLINSEEVNQILNVLKEIEANQDYVSQLTALVASNEPAIGIICMYGAQKRLLRRKFNEQAWSPEFRSLIKIDTVDSYQGKENRIIIVSITRNGKDRRPKFLKEPNRINVAMSRAMDRLLIVGSMQMWNRENSSLPLGRVTSYIQKHQDEDYCIVPAIPTEKRGGKR